MDNKSRISKYLKYIILILFVVVLSITLINFDVNIISDIFYSVVDSLNSSSLFSLLFII